MDYPWGNLGQRARETSGEARATPIGKAPKPESVRHAHSVVPGQAKRSPLGIHGCGLDDFHVGGKRVG